MPDRTDLVWTYEPADFFEAPYSYSGSSFDLLANAGTVTVTLRPPHEPVDQAEQDQIAAVVKLVLDARQQREHRPYQLHGAPKIVQHAEGKTNTIIQAQAAEMILVAGRADVTLSDPNGVVIHSTQAARLTDDEAVMALLVEPGIRSPTIRAVLDSFDRSVKDPANEFLHLYEIRDALSKHFGDSSRARAALGVSAAEWSRFGNITNGAAAQSRHRGNFVGNSQPASSEELDEVRSIARRWILSLARTFGQP